MDGGKFVTRILCVSIMLIIWETSEAGKLKCDPLHHVRYHKDLQDCVSCDTCPKGFGKIPLEESKIDIDPVYGSTSCIECRRCKKGFFSTKHAYVCQMCTNCTLNGNVVLEPCTVYKDAVCSNRSEPKPGKSRENSLMEIPRPETDNEDNNDKDLEWTDHKLWAIVAVFVAVIVILVLIITLCFRRRLNKVCHICKSAEEGSTTGKVYYDSVPVEEQPDVSSNGSFDNECYNVAEETDSCEEMDEATPLQPPRSKFGLLKRHLSDPGHSAYSPHTTGVEEDGLKTGRRKSLPNLNKIHPLDPVPRSFNSQPYMTQMINSLPTKYTETDDELTPGTLMKVARYLANHYKYKIFARCTGMSETDLINIQQNHRDDTTEQAYQVLRKIVHKNIIVKLSDLLILLSRAGLLDIIEKLKQNKALD